MAGNGALGTAGRARRIENGDFVIGRKGDVGHRAIGQAAPLRRGADDIFKPTQATVGGQRTIAASHEHPIEIRARAKMRCERSQSL